MSFKLNTQHFDGGHVSERESDIGERNRQHLIVAEKNAIGGATAWLVFYAIAIAFVVASNFQKVADVVVAAMN